MSDTPDHTSPLEDSPIEQPNVEAEVLRTLADNARFEVQVRQACDGSMLAQKAACLEWLACGAEYKQAVNEGKMLPSTKLEAAQQELVKQVKFLMS